MMKITRRELFRVAGAADSLKNNGVFQFRLAVARIIATAQTEAERFNEARKTVDDLQAYQTELSEHKKNCTSKEGEKEMVDVESYMKLERKTAKKYSEAIKQVKEINLDSNKMLDDKIEIDLEKLKEEVIPADIDVSMLAVLVPFIN